MNRRVLFYLSLAAIIFFAAGSSLLAFSDEFMVGTFVFTFGGAAAFSAWVLGMARTARSHRWGWFFAILLLSPLSTLTYGLFGPEDATF